MASSLNSPAVIKAQAFNRIPCEVDLKDLKENKKLFSDEQVAAIIEAHRNGQIKLGRTTKEDLNKILKTNNINLPDVQFSIECDENNTISGIYKGVKHDKQIGEGEFGSVKHLQDIQTGVWVDVLKVMKDSDSIESEVYILRRNQQLKGYSTRINSKGMERGEIAMPRAEGISLYKFLRSGKKMPVARWLDLGIAMLEAYETMHQEYQTLHCDIKPENMNYDPISGKVTPVDHGNSAVVKNVTLGREFCQPRGTRGYMAPESNEKGFYYNEKTEVYGLGQSLKEVFNNAQITKRS